MSDLKKQSPRRARESDYDTVVKDDLRPAGNGKDCFYCAQPLGSKHKRDCVIRLGAGQYLVAIRHNSTGEIRMYRFDMRWQDEDELSFYHWTDGNYGCDCNRHLFFIRAAGIDEWEERECGSTEYSCLYAELPDGSRREIDQPLSSGETLQ
jgi:hypothetical protein